MKRVSIEILDSVHCQIKRQDIKTILPCLQYDKTYWRQGQFKRTKHNYTASFIDKKTGIFLTGFLPRVKRHCENLSVLYDIVGEEEKLISPFAPSLEDIVLREDQLWLIDSATKSQRGIILSPTGSGKTMLMMGIVSMFPESKVLLLCHSLSIVRQTYDEMVKFGFKNLALLGGGNNKWPDNAKIIISTIQTFVKMDPDLYCDYFDIMICDEVHRASAGLESQYGKVLQQILSPMKIGFTATSPEQKERQLILEGLIGPVIQEFSIQEGIDRKILAKPVIRLIPIPFSDKLSGIYKYPVIYERGIVKNRRRNNIIIKLVMERIDKNKTILILIKNIEHGEELLKITNLYGLQIEFVQGSTDEETREKTKKALIRKEVKCVIATVVWKEGVNLPNLNCIINAAGGKSELGTLQAIGRGLRTTKDKSEVEIIDFLDPYRYLAEHSVLRMQTYVRAKWL